METLKEAEVVPARFQVQVEDMASIAGGLLHPEEWPREKREAAVREFYGNWRCQCYRHPEPIEYEKRIALGYMILWTPANLLLCGNVGMPSFAEEPERGTWVYFQNPRFSPLLFLPFNSVNLLREQLWKHWQTCERRVAIKAGKFLAYRHAMAKGHADAHSFLPEARNAVG